MHYVATGHADELPFVAVGASAQEPSPFSMLAVGH